MPLRRLEGTWPGPPATEAADEEDGPSGAGCLPVATVEGAGAGDVAGEGRRGAWEGGGGGGWLWLGEGLSSSIGSSIAASAPDLPTDKQLESRVSQSAPTCWPPGCRHTGSWELGAGSWI